MFGYTIENGKLLPKKSDNIYPSDDELTPNCNCEKCARKTCPCVTAKIPCCKFCFCKTVGECKNKN